MDWAPDGVGLLLMAPRELGPHSDSDSLCRRNQIVPRRLPTEASLPVPTCTVFPPRSRAPAGAGPRDVPGRLLFSLYCF